MLASAGVRLVEGGSMAAAVTPPAAAGAGDAGAAEATGSAVPEPEPGRGPELGSGAAPAAAAESLLAADGGRFEVSALSTLDWAV